MIKKIIIISLVTLTSTLAAAATIDTITIDSAIKRVLNNYPSVESARKAILVSQEQIKAAKASYLPDISASASYNNMGPLSKVDMPGFGTLSFQPRNSYSLSADVSQIIYDFGQTARNVELALKNRDISKLTLEELQRGLIMTVVSKYYSLAFSSQAVEIKNMQIRSLQEHLAYVKKLGETGSATNYEILTTNVRITSAQNDLTELLASQHNALVSFNMLLGESAQTDQLISANVEAPIVDDRYLSDVTDLALDSRPDVKIAAERVSQGEIEYRSAKASNNPVLSAVLSGGAKNGYFHDINAPKLNYVVGATLKVPIFMGGKSKIMAEQARLRTDAARNALEETRRGVVEDVSQAQSSILSARSRILLSEGMVEQSVEALRLAEVSYRSGSITYLDLLDATLTEAQSRLQLLKARVDLAVATYQLLTNVGGTAPLSAVKLVPHR